MTRPYLRVLGILQVGDAHAVPTKLPTRKAEALAAILALSNGAVARDRILGLLWGDRGEAQARHSLSQALTALRRTFGNATILADRDAVSVDPHAIDIDVQMFRDLKSRLVREFIATALRPGWHTIAAGTDPQFAEAAVDLHPEVTHLGT